jgi:hypothetical protein
VTQPDPVREYLRQRGASYSVIANGLRGLVDNWERVVAEVEAGYDRPFDDYLNDLDGRQLLANALEIAPEEVREAYTERIAAADARVKAVTRPSARCLWGQIVADEEGWKPDRNWWYFLLPTAPGPRLAAELAGW